MAILSITFDDKGVLSRIRAADPGFVVFKKQTAFFMIDVGLNRICFRQYWIRGDIDIGVVVMNIGRTLGSQNLKFEC